MVGADDLWRLRDQSLDEKQLGVAVRIPVVEPAGDCVTEPLIEIWRLIIHRVDIRVLATAASRLRFGKLHYPCANVSTPSRGLDRHKRDLEPLELRFARQRADRPSIVGACTDMERSRCVLR